MTTNWAEITDGVCTNTAYCEDPEFAEAMNWIPLPDGFGIGDLYDGKEWTKKPEPEPEPVDPPEPSEQRRQAYETMPMVEWHGELITVDAANAVWVQYAAEGSDTAAALEALIHTAKEQIRAMYPDN